METWTMEVPSDWDTGREVQRRVLHSLETLPKDLRDSAAMVATELYENAVKYGAPTASCPLLKVEFLCDDETIVIGVSNGVSDPLQLQRLRERVSDIQNANDETALYERRFRELAEQGLRESSVGLGLYRIAAEGKFGLQWSCEHGMLRVQARRHLHGDAT